MRAATTAAGLGLALSILLAGNAVQAQTTCASETGYQPTKETGYQQGNASDWCSRTQAYWEETIEHASKKQFCSGGRRQSPIALTTPSSQDLNLFPIDFSYTDWDENKRTLNNNGHTVELPLYEYGDRQPGYRRINLARRNYVLLQMHFHYPSEHTVDGERYALELHLVHANNEDRAVLALLVKPGATNPALDALFRDMPTAKGTKRITVKGSDVNRLFPSDKTYLTYKGSLTTPSGDKGCDEDVTWAVFKTPIFASQTQIDNFKAAISYETPFKVNARPLADGQTVRTSEGRSVGLWKPGLLNARRDPGGQYYKEPLKVIPGAGAGPAADASWFRLRGAGTSFVDVQFTLDKPRDLSISLTHRAAGSPPGYAPIGIKVNNNSIVTKQEVRAQEQATVKIPRTSVVQGDNTLRLALHPDARTDYEIQGLWLYDPR